jgi:RNA polymerase sigma-70 factor (ECF subfamily)
MPGRESSKHEHAVVYCVIPRDLAPRLHDLLRSHFSAEQRVEVVVERRSVDRRLPGDRRQASEDDLGFEDRRRIRALPGRRVTDRRLALLPVGAPDLPRRARPFADRLVFVERLEPSDLELEDLDTARLIGRIQSGDRDGFVVLYTRYFDRVYSHLRLVLRNREAAEDATQQVFVQVLAALPRYERRAQPFRAWLFTVVRNLGLRELTQQRGASTIDPAEIDEARELTELDPASEPIALDPLDWLTDRELLLFVERMPLAQRQVLALRYMLGLNHAEIAAVLGKSHSAIRVLHSRALEFLRARLAAVGREPKPGRRSPMRRTLRYAQVLRARRFALMR